MPEPTADLQFEHATYEQAPQGVVCAMCKKPVGAEYWQWTGRVTCAGCVANLRQLEAHALSPVTFGRAVLVGTAAALGCGAAYAIFVAVLHFQFALVTIGIAYVVATAIRKQTGNISGRSYQVLAMALTYLGGSMGYLPYLFPSGTTAGQVLGALPEVVRLMLEAPFVAAKSSPLGLLIVGIGLLEAWRRARPLPMVFTGPYRVPPPGASPVP